nr:hypothetical protein [Tanacetum cinerariifolium]
LSLFEVSGIGKGRSTIVCWYCGCHHIVGNKMLKAFPLLVMSSHCQKTFPLLVKKGSPYYGKDIPLLKKIALLMKTREVIEFDDCYEAPKDDAAIGTISEGSAKKNGRKIVVTTEDMQKRMNDVKARTTLLLALLDVHQLRFSKYNTAQELWAAILKTFGGNKAIRKTKKNLLKKQYGNFKAEGKETLEQTFNRLQATVSHLEFMDVEIEQDDLNQNLLTSLTPECLMHTIVEIEVTLIR